jgi:hypothetical protein
MTKIILTFPVGRVFPLSCVWIETGELGQPLVCRWTARPVSGSDFATPEASEPERRRLCA